MSDRRTQILDAAAAVFAERGFNQTSVEEVVRRAGLCGKSHFYHYFRSKEELGYAVLEYHFECFSQSGLALLRDRVADPLVRLNGFMDSLVARQAEKGCKGGATFGSFAAELADTHEGFRRVIDAVFMRWTEQLEALLWELRPQLRDGTDIRRLARLIIAALEGGLLMSRVSREICVLEGIVEDLKLVVVQQLREQVAPVSAGVALGSAGASVEEVSNVV